MTDLMLLVAQARLRDCKRGRVTPEPQQPRMATAGGRSKLALFIMLLVAAGLMFAPSADGRKSDEHVAEKRRPY
jgi:hypothetical protein